MHFYSVLMCGFYESFVFPDVVYIGAKENGVYACGFEVGH